MENISINIIVGCIILYIIILPYLDYELLNLINSTPIKIIFSLLIVYFYNKSPKVAVILLLIYVLSIQQYSNKDNSYNYMNVIDYINNYFKKPTEDKVKNEHNKKIKVTHQKYIQHPNTFQPPKLSYKDNNIKKHYKDIDNWSMFTPIVPNN